LNLEVFLAVLHLSTLIGVGAEGDLEVLLFLVKSVAELAVDLVVSAAADKTLSFVKGVG